MTPGLREWARDAEPVDWFLAIMLGTCCTGLVVIVLAGGLALALGMAGGCG